MGDDGSCMDRRPGMEYSKEQRLDKWAGCPNQTISNDF